MNALRPAIFYYNLNWERIPRLRYESELASGENVLINDAYHPKTKVGFCLWGYEPEFFFERIAK